MGLYSNDISTHTLTWSVTPNVSSLNAKRRISTHTLTWSVTTFLVTRNENIGFQLTRSRGAWPCKNHVHRTCQQFQLTRSRGAWLNVALKNSATNAISTHTLTWSVTLCGVRFSLTRKFQLTRSRGAWRNSAKEHTLFEKFQLTRSRGAWRSADFVIYCIWIISTHTLTWSVTQ